MYKKRSMLAGFAIFATMLMLVTPSIAGPIRQKVVSDSATSEPVEDDGCSLCAQDISIELTAAIQYLEAMQRNGAIPPELSDEVAQIVAMIGTTDWSDEICERIYFFLVLTLALFDLIQHISMFDDDCEWVPQWWYDLYDIWFENCHPWSSSSSSDPAQSPGSPITR